jgi:FtsP/CotA-like multicopper oxidase with cupredoxin domain
VKRVVAVALTALAACLGVAVLAWLGWAWYESRLPATYSVMDYAIPETGGKPLQEPMRGHAHGTTSVVDLRPAAGQKPHVIALTALETSVRLATGHTVRALTFNGTVPGPELRVRRGELVEVTLVNRNVNGGVTIHWHGVDVENAEDGVAGVTQDAVLPGASHTYRFRPDRAGTFWYHTHQASSSDVRRGLYGALVVQPKAYPSRPRGDFAVAVHTLEGTPLVNATPGVERHAVAPGTPVRLRLINTDDAPRRLDVGGTPFRVVAIDGTDLNGPTALAGRTLVLAAGGRYDIAFPMPQTPVRLAVEGTEVGVALSSDGKTVPPAPPAGPVFDPAAYGHPAPTPFRADSHFDRVFELTIDRKPGFFDGQPGMQWALNGHIYPRVPMFMVERGDLVRVTIRNASGAVHPMHLHGHHMLVLSRNGKPVSGSPWWSDTLNVEPGERYDVAFRADNPGIWMDHCHNLAHAAAGLTMHVAYAGVTTPYVTGGASHNHPE